MLDNQIPEASTYGVVGSRAWPDLSAVHRVVTALIERGRPIAIGGGDTVHTAAVAAGAAAHARGLLHRFSVSVETGGAADRDERFLRYLEGGGSLLIAFLAANSDGHPGRSHEICRLARAHGIAVVEILPTPDADLTPNPELARSVARAVDHLSRATSACIAGEFSRHALYRVAVSTANQVLEALPDLERRLDRQWAWLDANPLAVDFGVREYRTLCLLAGYTALQDVADRLNTLVRDHADQADYVPAHPVAVERSVRDAWAS